MREAFGIERLARSAPSTILAVAVGVLAYVPAFLITLTVAVQVGLIWP